MKVIKITEKEYINKSLNVLKAGGVVAYPTETSYGLGCDMANKHALEKVYRLKGRSQDKPLSVLVASYAMAEEYVEFSPRAFGLAKQYWPGALTLVLPLVCHPERSGQAAQAKRFARFLPRMLRGRNDTKIVSPLFLLPGQTMLALRISSHPIAQALVEKLGRPIAATSANISGEDNIYDPKSLIEQFKGRDDALDMIIDAGVLPPVQPSTIVEVVGEDIKILRQGAIILNQEL